MKNRRLTLEDRRRIHAMLREGKQFIEISRELGYPKSETIRREVNRNGGVDFYDPIVAHDKTKRANVTCMPEKSMGVLEGMQYRLMKLENDVSKLIEIMRNLNEKDS